VSDLSPDARAILDAGRDADGAGDIEKARVRRALFATIAAGAAGGGATLAGGAAAAAPTATMTTTTAGATGATVAATTSLPLAAKILVPLAILAAGGVGGTVAWHARGAATPAPAVHSVAPAPAPSVAPAPVVVPVVTEPARPAPAPRHANVATHAAAPVHADAPVVTTNRLAEETALLSSANAALRAGDSTRALGLLDDYDRRYPAGVLREEVLATRIIARCELGAAGAVAGAEAFLARHPTSPLAPRVRSSCER
jgi:hypothetical protein